MRHFATVFISILSFTLHAQTYEIGATAGGANYIGDVGPTTYISPNDVAIGAMFRWNRSPRHSFRFSALYAKLKSDDADSDETRRQERGYSFTNNIIEMSLGLEYTFWEFDMHSGKPQYTPYLYTGFVYFNYESLFLTGNNELKNYGKAWAYGIPMAAGYKMTVGRNMVVGLELGARYTFTDNLDGSNPTGVKANQDNLKFGNLKSNDWYVYTGISVSFTFGRKPCYCVF